MCRPIQQIHRPKYSIYNFSHLLFDKNIITLSWGKKNLQQIVRGKLDSTYLELLNYMFIY